MIIQRIGQATSSPAQTGNAGIQRISAGQPLPRVQQFTPQPEVVQVKPDQNKGSFIEGAKKFVARSAVNFADLVTESLDFATNFIVDNPIFNKTQETSQAVLKRISPKLAEKQEQEINKWKGFYTGLAEKPKLAVDKIQQTEYLQPSKQWQEAPLKEKLTKHLGETLAVLGPNIIPSFILYAANPVLGVATTIGSTGNDVRRQAIETGVDKDKAELLGLGTGIFVGALDRIVPDELFSPAQKSRFVANFVKRIIPLALKEAGTEIAQEDIQIVAEKTFREDLGWDEVKTRNALAGLGGLLGGAGATMVVGTMNNFVKGDILEQEDQKVEQKNDQVPVQEKTDTLESTTEPSEPEVLQKTGTKQEKQEIQTPSIKPVEVKRDIEFEKEVQGKIQTNVKNIKDVKKALGTVKENISNLITEAEGKSVVAQSQREGLNTDNIAKLKRIYSINKKFREGDIETIRNSKAGELLNTVIENVQEKNPYMSEQEALDYALSLPTKAEENVKADTKALQRKQKALIFYLESLKKQQEELNLAKDEILDKEWREVLAQQEELAKAVEVPRSQLPVGEGKEKTSKLEARITENLNNAPEDVKKLSTYSQMVKKDQIQKAAEYVEQNPEEALQVLKGEKEAPEGILKNSIYVAMQNQATGDVELARKLASLASTRAGQEISILTEIDEYSPVKIMSELVKIREQVFQDKYKGEEQDFILDKTVKEIKKTVQKPNKYDWNTFLDSIEC